MDEDVITMQVQEERAIVYLPKDAINVKILAKIYTGEDHLATVSKTMDMHELREAFRKAEEGYIDEDDTFVLTEKGKKYLEDLEWQERIDQFVKH